LGDALVLFFPHYSFCVFDVRFWFGKAMNSGRVLHVLWRTHAHSRVQKVKKTLTGISCFGDDFPFAVFWIFTLVTGPLAFIPLQYEYGMYGSLLGMQKVGIGERWPAEIWV
jgi:hypothetical protein